MLKETARKYNRKFVKRKEAYRIVGILVLERKLSVVSVKFYKIKVGIGNLKISYSANQETWKNSSVFQ